MNPSRSQRYVAALLGAIFLFLGYNIGFVLDQAAGLNMDRALMVAFQECYCLEAAVPLAANVIRANAWTLTGALGGLLLGVAAGWALSALRQGPASGGRRYSSFRQASELARFSQALSHTLELERILEQVHAEVLHVTGADCGSSFLLDPASPEHRVARRAGEGAELTRLTPMEAEAVSTGRGRLVRDFEAEGEAPPHVGIRSALLAPIVHEEQAIGLIHLHSQTPDAFDSEAHDFVQVLAAQAAVAINNAQRYEEQSRRSEALRQRVNQLQQLAEIPNTVRADRPLAANLESIAQTMQQAGGFGFALIYVFAPEANHLRLATAAGLAPEWFERLRQQPAPWERLQPFLRDEFRSERVFVTPQAQLADVYQALELSAPRKAHEPRTPGQWHPDDLLLVPLHGAGGEVAGLLAVNAPRDPQAPRGPVLDMLAVFASQATLAIENAQLLREAEERVNESQARAVQLGALTEATGLMAASLRVEEVITRGLDQLRRIVPYDAVTFWQRDLNDGRWQVAGARSYQEAIERVIERAERSQPRLFSEIVATRGVISVGDVSRDVRFSAREVSAMRSWLGVPVQSGGQVTGILALEKGEDGYFGAAQTPVALAFASRLGAALENARLHEESVRHAREMETRGHRLALLNRIAGDLAAGREAGAVLGLALQALHEALETACAVGVLFESDVPLATPAILAEHRLPAGTDGPPLALRDNALLDRLAETGAHLLAEAGHADGDSPARAEHLAWVGPGTATALFLPLAAEGRLLGVLGLGHHAGSRFLSGDVDLAWATAQQVALAVRNLRLQARTREQAIMHEVTRSLSRPASRADLYAALHQTLCTLAGMRYFTLALHDATRNETIFPLVVEEGAVIAAAASHDPLPPSGLVRHVIQSRQAVRLAGEVAAQAQALGAPLTLPGHHPVRGRAGPAGAPLAQAYLAVPLMLGERVTGVLLCEDHDRAGAFDDQSERLVAAAAAQAAITLENVQVYEQAREGLAEAQTRATHLEALTEIATQLAAAQRTDEVVAAALDQARRLLPYDHANFWLREGGERRAAAWRLAGARGEAVATPGAAHSFEAGTPLGDILTARRALAVPDTGRDARFTGPGRAWLGVPLLSGDEVIGVLEFVAAAPGALAAGQVKPAQALAARVTAGLEQARRFEAGLNQAEALDQQARRLAQLNQAAVTLAGQQEVEGLLATTARLALECLRALRAGIVLFADETTELRAVRLPEPGADGEAQEAARAAAPLLRRLRGATQALSLAELNAANPAPAEQLLWVGGGVESAVFAPLQAGGEALGVLAVGAPDAGRTFTAEDLEALAGLAGLAAAALHKALQHEAARQRLAEHALAGLMSRALSQATSTDGLADALYAQLDAWLKPRRAWLAVYDPARHQLSFPLALEAGQRVAREASAPDPIFNYVLNTQQPLLLAEREDADLAAQLRALDLPTDALGGASSFLAAPLRLGDTPLGVLALADPGRAPRLADTHQRILAAVALQAAISLESARGHAEQAARVRDLEARAGRLAWLNHTSAEVAAALEPEPILQTALATLSEVLHAEQAAAVLFEESGSARLLARHPQPTEAAEPARLQLAGQPLFERLLPGLAQMAGPVLLDDLPAEPDLKPEHYAWLHSGSRAAAFFPLAAGGELLGVAAFARSAPGPVFEADGLEQAQAVLEQAAVAVRNASRYQTTQTRLAEQTTISQLSRALSRSLELPELLRSVREQLAAWLEPKTLNLALYDEARNQVTFPLAVMLGQTLELPPRAPQGLLRHVLQGQQGILASAGAPERLAELGLSMDALGEAETFLGAPLLAGGRLIGALTVSDPQRVPALTDTHTRIFTALAGQIAVSVDNARQHELTRQAIAAAQERSTQAGRLAEAMGAVAGALHTSEVVNRALAQLQRLTQAEALTYWRRNGGSQPAWEAAATRRPAAVGPVPEPAPLPTALAEALAAGRAPVEVADMSRDRRFSGSLLRRAAAWLGVPVISQGEVVGLLTLEAAQPQGFQPGHAALAESFARQTALALENAERHEASLRRVQEFERRGEALTRIAVDLHSTLELEALAPLAAHVLASAFSADSAGLLVVAESPLGGGLSLQAHGQSPAPARPSAPRLSGNLLVELLRDAVRPVPIADLSAEGGLEPEHTAWAGSGLRAGLFLPLRHGGRLLGVAGVGSAQPRAWNEAELELAQALAAQMAAAINNAQRHADAEAGLREQSTSLQIIRGLSQAAGVADLVMTLRARLGEWLGADSVDLALYDEAANTATLAGPAEDGQRRTGPVFAPGGLLLRVLETRRSLRLTGEAAHDSFALGQPADAGLARPTRWSDREGEPAVGVSFLAAPVLLGEQRLGVLAVEAEDRAGAFTERHERLLTGIAAQVAVTLDQLHLRSQARLALEAAHERVSHLEALAGALSALTAAGEDDDVAGLALEQFRQVVAYDRAAFWRRDDSGAGGWQLAAARGAWTAGALAEAEAQPRLDEVAAGRALVLGTGSNGAHEARLGAASAFGSWLGLPLINRGAVIGVVTLEAAEANAYTARQAALAQTLGQQAAAVYAQARQMAVSLQRVVELDERARRLAFLNRFAGELNANLDLNHILRLTLKALAEANGAELGAAAAFDEARATLLALEHYPDPAASGGPMGQLLLPGSSLLDRLQDAAEPVTVDAAGLAEMAARLRPTDWRADGAPAGGAHLVPLMSGGHLVGLVGLGQNEAGRLTPSEAELTRAIAERAAAALLAARQLEQTQQRLAEQATINQITRAFSRAGDLHALSEGLWRQMQAWIGVDWLYVAVQSEDRNEVTFPLAVEAGQAVGLEPRAPAGLVRHLIHQRQSVRLNGDVPQQLKALGLYVTGLGQTIGLDDAAPFTACVGVPLMLGEQAIGALIAANPRRTEQFDDSHERIFAAVAGRLAAALNLARQHEQALAVSLEAQARAAQLTDLAEAAGVIASARRTDQLISLTLEQLRRLLPYDGAAFWRREGGLNGADADASAGAARWRLAAARGSSRAGPETGVLMEFALARQDPLAEVLSLRAPVVIADTSSDARFGRAGAWLGIPLAHDNEVLGLVALEKREPGGFTAAHLPLARAFGKQAAVALANVRLFEASTQRSRELDERTTLLNRVAASFSTSVEPQTVLQTALASLAELLGVDRAAALLLDDARAMPRARAQAHFPPGALGPPASLPLTPNLLLDHLREGGTPVTAPDVGADAVILPEHAAWIGPDVKSALFLPLTVAGRLIGLIGLGETRMRRQFAPADSDLALTLANQAAIAVHNARLYQRTQRRMVEMAAISQSSRAISQTIDLQELFETVRAQVEVDLRVDSLYVALYDEARHEVSFPLAVERGQAVELSPRPPDALIRHILTTRQSLLLTGDLQRKAAEAGLKLEAGAGGDPPAGRAKAYLGVPLLIGAKVRGVLAVEDHQRAYAFTEKHERSLLSIAAPIAAAVDGARLYAESARRALALDARAALLGRMAAELSEAAEPAAVLRFTVQVLAETLQADVAGALALDDNPESAALAALARYPDDDGALPAPAVNSPLLARLAESLSPLSLDDVAAAPEARAAAAAWLGPEVQSALFLPLIAADRLVGLAAVGHTHAERSFAPGEVELAMTLVSQASVALANARAQQKLQPRLAELATISRICQALGRPTSLAQLCDLLRAEVGGALQAEVLILAQYNEARGEVSYPLVFESGRMHAAAPGPAAGLLRRLLGQREALLLNGAEARAAADGLPLPGLAPNALIGVPLWLGGRPVGALVAADQDQAGRFTPSQAYILSTVATPIAVALENAQLHDERAELQRATEHGQAQVALAGELSRALLGVLDPASVLRQSLEALGSALDVTTGAAALAPEAASGAWRVVRPADAGSAPAEIPPDLLARLSQPSEAVLVYSAPERLKADLGWAGDDLQAALVLPLRAGGDLIGLLVLGDGDAPRTFTAESVALAMLGASQAAVALETARHYARERDQHGAAAARAEQLRAAAMVAQAFSAARGVEAVAAAALEHLPRVLPYDSAAVWVVEAGARGWMRVAAARGSSAPRPSEAVDPRQDAVLAEALEAGGVRTTELLVKASPEAKGRPAGWSRLTAVLGPGEHPVGVLVLEKAAAGFYQAEHTRIAPEIAAPLAAALEHARQHEAAAAQASELTAHGEQLRRAAEARLAEQAALNRLWAALDAAQSWSAAAAALVEPAQAALGVNTLYLAVCNDSVDQVSFPLMLERGQRLEAATRPAEGVIGHILQTRRPLLLAGDVAGGLLSLRLPHRGEQAERAAGDPSAARAFAGAPLLHGGRVLGVLAAEDLQRADGLGEAQVNWLQAAAHLLAATAARLEAAAEAARTAAQLAEARAQFAQASQAARGFEHEAQTQARELAELEARHARAVAAARELEQALDEREQARQAWQARASAALAEQAAPAPDDLNAALEKELRHASQALQADAGALFLWDAGADRLEARAAVGEASAEQMEALARVVISARAADVFPDLANRERKAAAPDGPAEPAGEPGEPAPAEAAPEAGPSPHISGLALPIFALDGEAPAGALVFLGRRPAAFAVDAPAGVLAAEQAGLRLRAAALSEALRAQTRRFRALLDDPALQLPPAPAVDLEGLGPASLAPVAPPAWEAPVALPAEPPALLDRTEAERPARPAWRRAALPAAIGLMVVCGLAAVTVGPLRGMAAGLLGGAAATETPSATATAPAASPANPTAQPTAEPTATASLEPTDTLAPATPTPTASITPTSAPTETSTPSISPTPPLPPDVTAVAVVNLPEGIAGRLRDAPNGNVVGGVPGDTLVHVLAGRETTPDNIVWVRIRLPATGQTGWFAEDLLIYQTPGG